MLKRPDARLVTISTAGQGAETPLGRLRARALAQPHAKRHGALTDCRGPTLRALEWGVPEDTEATPAAAKRANPASWITVGALRDQHDALPPLAWQRFRCGRWTAREGSWLPPGAWQACVGEPRFEPGERVWLGCDVGGERSATAVVYVNEALQVGARIWTGDEG